MKKLTKKIILPTILISFIGAGIGLAKQQKMNFSFLDQNADGFISEIEITNWHLNRMLELDTDKDGLISRNELLAKIKHRELRMFHKLDFDGNGKLSKKEFDWIRSMKRMKKKN